MSEKFTFNSMITSLMLEEKKADEFHLEGFQKQFPNGGTYKEVVNRYAEKMSYGWIDWMFRLFPLPDETLVIENESDLEGGNVIFPGNVIANIPVSVNMIKVGGNFSTSDHYGVDCKAMDVRGDVLIGGVLGSHVEIFCEGQLEALEILSTGSIVGRKGVKTRTISSRYLSSYGTIEVRDLITGRIEADRLIVTDEGVVSGAVYTNYISVGTVLYVSNEIICNVDISLHGNLICGEHIYARNIIERDDVRVSAGLKYKKKQLNTVGKIKSYNKPAEIVLGKWEKRFPGEII